MRRAMLLLTIATAALAGAEAAAAQYPRPAAEPASANDADSGPITALQQQLKREGYMPGPVNGVMTEETRQALATYERRRGRPPAGTTSGEGDPVRRVQAALQRLGMFDGPLDGVVGPATRDAIIRFEASHHIAVDPRVSDRLLAALEGAGGTPAATAAAPAPTPAATPAPAPAPPAAAENAPAAAAPMAPEATGRRPLPAWLNPPPIR